MEDFQLACICPAWEQRDKGPLVVTHEHVLLQAFLLGAHDCGAVLTAII